MLQEYPSKKNGFGRSDTRILTLPTERERSFESLFIANHNLEDADYLGDPVFRSHVEVLAGLEAAL